VDYTTVAVDVTQDPPCLPNAYTLPQDIATLTFIEGTEPRSACTTPTSVQLIPVPSAIGLEKTAAEDLLRRSGFYVDVETEASSQPPGTVISQTPGPGVSAYQATDVTVTVSTETAA
jgi:hypothetical protein